MTLRTILTSLAVVGISLGIPSPARAHRLDELLQATLLSIDRDQVTVEITLTAGTSLAAQVFGSIDTNGDGRISAAEGHAYARGVLNTVQLSVDALPAILTVNDYQFPDLHQMSLGVGTIRLRATAKIPPAAVGRHQLSFRNMHRPGSSVYLVNPLVPTDHQIRIGEQRRDAEQRSLTLDYSVVPSESWVQGLWLIAGLVVMGAASRAWRY